MESVFYKRFERHAHGEGIKAHATHYCPGCGHGLAHKYLAESIEELGIQSRTVAISPVGCAVFLYYYLDVGNTQSAHGRAPAVAMGHKLANPESIVVSYQGDGDLASIGLAEIIAAAQIGLPITIIFVNNAIYGMTGGQLAPTTLMGQRTATSPRGRDRMMGEPLKMAEMIAGMDAPVYVERVALFNNKQRFRARKAIRKALKLQIDNIGFSFVEVLSECPTHLKITPEAAEKWVEENMVPVYPLGVLKDSADAKPWFDPGTPSFDPARVIQSIGGTSERIERFAKEFPTHLHPDDVALKFAGAGGDGAQMIARLTCQIGINEGFDSTYIPSYGPESRGGTSYADIHVAAEEVLSPASPEPHGLIAFNAPSLDKFGPHVQPGGLIVYDSTVIHDTPEVNDGVRFVGVPFTQIAADLGKLKVKNTVALSAFRAASEIFPAESVLAALKQALHENCAMLELNEEAFRRGQDAVIGEVA